MIFAFAESGVKIELLFIHQVIKYLDSLDLKIV